jgi:tetrahydromethanopterin S-methyltransferase subunit E
MHLLLKVCQYTRVKQKPVVGQPLNMQMLAFCLVVVVVVVVAATAVVVAAAVVVGVVVFVVISCAKPASSGQAGPVNSLETHPYLKVHTCTILGFGFINKYS